ncbi:MAG: hypothetical protein HMLKMBBP_01816 [Planctomycetes bacterium]|nr:hypothetical protein [Planctomycetota bacterium]
MFEPMQPGMAAAVTCAASVVLGFLGGWAVRARRKRQPGSYVVSIPVWADPRGSGGAPTPKADAYIHRTLVTLREENVTLASKLRKAESDVRELADRLGRRVTGMRNLEAHVKSLEPLADQVKQRDGWLAEARAAAAAATAERDRLRAEVDWREFVIRDMEPLAARVAELEALLGDRCPPPAPRAKSEPATAKEPATAEAPVLSLQLEPFDPASRAALEGVAPGVLVAA